MLQLTQVLTLKHLGHAVVDHILTRIRQVEEEGKTAEEKTPANQLNAEIQVLKNLWGANFDNSILNLAKHMKLINSNASIPSSTVANVEAVSSFGLVPGQTQVYDYNHINRMTNYSYPVGTLAKNHQWCAR